MMFVSVYREPLYRIHKANLFSLATLVQIGLAAIVIGVPIALVADNPDAWPMQTVSREQVSIRFTKTAFCYLYTSNGSTFSWSTIENFNQLSGSRNLPVMGDSVNGTRSDTLMLSWNIPLSGAVNVTGLTSILFVDYFFTTRINAFFTGMVVLQHSPGFPGSSLFIDATVRPAQKGLLEADLQEPMSQMSLLNLSSANLEDFSFRTLAARDAERPVTLVIENQVPIWTPKQPLSNEFRVDVILRAPSANVWIKTTVLHRFATAGSQFIFWFVIFWTAAWWVAYLVFTYGLIPSIDDPKKFTVRRLFENTDGEKSHAD